MKACRAAAAVAPRSVARGGTSSSRGREWERWSLSWSWWALKMREYECCQWEQADQTAEKWNLYEEGEPTMMRACSPTATD